jgi:hypothetical protein
MVAARNHKQIQYNTRTMNSTINRRKTVTQSRMMSQNNQEHRIRNKNTEYRTRTQNTQQEHRIHNKNTEYATRTQNTQQEHRIHTLEGESYFLTR